MPKDVSDQDNGSPDEGQGAGPTASGAASPGPDPAANGSPSRPAGQIEPETSPGADAPEASTPGEGQAPDPEVIGSDVANADQAPDDGADAGSLGAQAEFTPEQIDALVAERDEFLDAYQRTAADFDNFRKQSQKRLTDEVARAQSNFVERLLPVLDALDAAEAHGSTDVDTIAKQLFGFLEKEGLERVHPDGEVFDPEVAEAVMHEPGEGEPTVVEVLRTGYIWNGRVIRAAMVKVAG